MRKLDRILVNTAFTDRFGDCSAMFLGRGLSDHSPGLVGFKGGKIRKNHGFKFDNCLAVHPSFLQLVSDVWKIPIEGSFMYQVLKKLKRLKPHLRRLRSQMGPFDERRRALKLELDEIQNACDKDPVNKDLLEDLAHVHMAYQQVILEEELEMKQKAKVKWLNEGDGNTKFFHQVVKEKRSSSRTCMVIDTQGIAAYDDDVPKVFIEYFTSILGTVDQNVHAVMEPELFSTKLPLSEALFMIRPILDKEIYDALSQIGNDKAPGSDGFSSLFFKASWKVVGQEVMRAIHNFFYSGRLDRELNHTLLCLIPKVPNASKVSDFRPISCCSVLYKCISKIIADRMKPKLNDLVNKAQSAFIPGRRISDNILMAHELVSGYHLDTGQPRCALKIDLRKAYDMVSWDFLICMLQGLEFHPALVKWIKVMLSSTSFSIAVNGESHGFFEGKRGIRQGDPLSPYLFTIVMEGFSLILRKCIEEEQGFRYHKGCQEFEITHLCFADDLFVFTNGDVGSINVIKKALDMFEKRSGLAPNLEKSDIFFGNCPEDVKQAIRNSLSFRVGVFPIRYLGVPLSPVRLHMEDFNGVVTRVKNRITNWKNKFLSYGGRRQLILSVLQSLQVYWMAVFIFPAGIIYELEALFRDFLWAQGDSAKGKCKLAWDDVCQPERFGGLGFRRLGLWNKCLVSKQIWDILANRNTLWVRWVKSHYIKNEQFWLIRKRDWWSWIFRSILKIRPLIRPFFITEIGDGNTTNAWEDKWLSIGHLGMFISYRNIHNMGFHATDTVCEFLSAINNVWPEEMLSRVPLLNNISIPTLSNNSDTIHWVGRNNVTTNFSIREAWRSMQAQMEERKWAKMVWNKAYIPKHAVCTWLACWKRLPTQDRILVWKHDPPDMKCLLCHKCLETHDHLFFQCSFSTACMNLLKREVSFPNFPDKWELILERFQNDYFKNWSTMQNLALSALIYNLWRERNRRLFENRRQKPEDIFKDVRDTILARMAWKTRHKERMVAHEDS